MHMAAHKSVPLHSVNDDAQSDDKLYRTFIVSERFRISLMIVMEIE